MVVAIISDELAGRKYRYDFDDEYDGRAELYNWTNASEFDVDALDTLVVDIDLSGRDTVLISRTTNRFRRRTRLTNPSEYETDELRKRFVWLNDTITNLLETGGVIIGLLSEEVGTGDRQPTSYTWLDHLQAFTQVDHDTPREAIRLTTDISAVNQYFDHIDAYEHGIRLEEGVVTGPDILAKHAVDNETVAVAVNEYLDPDGNYRQAPGYLVLLPQPTRRDDDFLGLIQALEEIGDHYHRRQGLDDILADDGSVRIETVLHSDENAMIEFKETLPENTTTYAKDLVAFANKWGGVLVIGVDDEDHTPTGVDDVDTVKNRIAGVIHNAIDPPLDPTMITHTIDGIEILTVHVSEGTDRPYSTEDKVYWRFGPTSRPLTGSEMEYLF